MECCDVRIRNMDIAKRRYQASGSPGNVDMEENGKNQLERTQDKCRSPTTSGREKNYDRDDTESTEKMDGPHLEKRQQYAEKHHRGKDGGKKRKRKTENYATRLDDRRGRIRRKEEKGTKQREMASMDIRTCMLKAENERRRISFKRCLTKKDVRLP